MTVLDIGCGYSPALSEVLPAIEQSGLMLTDVEPLRLHDAQPLRHWRSRLSANRDDICALYDERFCRMFEFYLAGAELAFRREREVVVQVQLSPSQTALPWSRDYMLGAYQDGANDYSAGNRFFLAFIRPRRLNCFKRRRREVLPAACFRRTPR
jgi:cyclopropane-fatty-acyl-phospholipid synthase